MSLLTTPEVTARTGLTGVTLIRFAKVMEPAERGHPGGGRGSQAHRWSPRQVRLIEQLQQLSLIGRVGTHRPAWLPDLIKAAATGAPWLTVDIEVTACGRAEEVMRVIHRSGGRAVTVFALGSPDV
jgi:hypothetical protein